MTRILFITDKPNWAFHSIAQSVAKYNPYDDAKISIMHSKGDEKKIRRTYKKFDRILVMGWQIYRRIPFFNQKNIFVGIHSHHSWDKKKTTPDKNVNPPRKLVNFLNSFRGVNVVSKRLYDLFRQNGVKRIFYTPNGVDLELFYSKGKKHRTQLRVGYSGSKSHDWRKGVTKFILPSIKRAGLIPHIAMLGTNHYISLKKMPVFYKSVDCYICASSSEGMSLSVLEAAASGCPIISTRCGGNSEIIKNDISGFFIDRNVNAITEKLLMLSQDKDLFEKMSQNIAYSTFQDLGWNHMSKAWMDFVLQ